MRVALLGNMNNNQFVVMRYLVQAGIDAHLLLYENELPHFKPEMDTYAYDQYRERIHQLNWGSYKTLLLKSKAAIKGPLEAYDYFIGTRLAPAYFNKIGKKLDLMIPTGGEFHTLPYYNGLQPTALLKWLFFSARQRRGLQKNTAKILWAKSHPDLEKRIATLGVGHKTVDATPPILYLPEYTHVSNAGNPLAARFDAIRKENDLVIVYHCRHTWKTILPGAMDNKDTHKLFLAFAEFLKETRLKAAIVTFAYGDDVAHSKTLVNSLNIAGHVHWFPLSARKNIMYVLKHADLAAGEFHRSFYSYGAVFEALAAGTPFMHNRDDRLYPGKSMYPMLFASRVEDIVAHLRKFEEDPATIRQIGSDAGTWFQHYTQQQVSQIVSLIRATT